MIDKKPNVSNGQENSEKPQNEKSEEFLRFEEAMRKIMNQSPEEVKRIRESPIPEDPDENHNN